MKRSPLMVAWAAASAAVFIAAACASSSSVPVVGVPPVTPQFASGSATASTTPPPGQELAVAAYTVPPKVTGKQKPACFARLRGQLPDPGCTPGSVGSFKHADGSIGPATVGEVCNPNFQKRYPRPDTRQAKTTAMLAYRIPLADKPRVEYDHLVPRSLGGSDDTSNLWPQISDLPLADEHNSKDDVEYELWRAVCVTRTVRLDQAQLQMARDWTAVEKFFSLR